MPNRPVPRPPQPAAPAPTVVSRYRLSLVREPVAPYDAEEGPPVRRPAEAARFLWEHFFHDETREVVVVLFLDTKNRATGHLLAYAGTLDRTPAEPRAILASALLHHAAGIVLAHNHPSGDPTPSTEDLLFNDRMINACDIVGIRFVDHLILGSGTRWRSLLRKETW